MTDGRVGRAGLVTRKRALLIVACGRRLRFRSSIRRLGFEFSRRSSWRPIMIDIVALRPWHRKKRFVRRKEQIEDPGLHLRSRQTLAAARKVSHGGGRNTPRCARMGLRRRATRPLKA